VTARILPDYNQLAEWLVEERKQGKSIALANGCFDLLHVGHIRLIQDARACADVLVLALNDDASVAANKGPGRPHVPLAERMEVIAALEGVHYVTSFSEPTADPLIGALRPDVHVKGTDWTKETVPERAAVLAYGGRIVIAGDQKRHSSSELIERQARPVPRQAPGR
jgi:rfaE bifunctional protein nucleotidyltransferase chain/domain